MQLNHHGKLSSDCVEEQPPQIPPGLGMEVDLLSFSPADVQTPES
jgi:hypothetical protein